MKEISSFPLVSKRPLVWALTTGRIGDDSQVMLAAEAVGGKVKTIELKFNRLRKIPNRLMGASTRSIKNTPMLGGPWPDLVVGAGCRSVPLALWIKKQSGGRSRLLRLGRPRAPLEWFDLIVTTPQYGLPASSNVMKISLPFASAPATAPSCDGPVVAVFGGDSRTCRFTAEFARAFACQAAEMAKALGTNLKVVTSPRTPSHAADALVEALADGVDVHLWRRDETGPYHAWLNVAQACLVTGDSASSITDAILTTQPVTVIMPPSSRWLTAVQFIGGRAMKKWFLKGGNRSVLAPPPDIETFISHIEDMGCARRVDKSTIIIEGASDIATREHAIGKARICELVSTS